MKSPLLFTVRALALLALTAAAIFAAEPVEIVSPGSDVTLLATADGVPAPTFEWFKNGAKVADGATLILRAVTPNDSASYTVKATNVAGAATSEPMLLAVAVPPTKPTIKITTSKPSGTTVSVPVGTRVVTTK